LYRGARIHWRRLFAHRSIFEKARKSDGVPSRNFALERSASYRRHSAKAKPKRSASYDASLYKKHNIIERFFSKLKQFRRVATRYELFAIRRLNNQSARALASITSPPSSTDNGVAPSRSNH
jgi:transposase